MAATTGDDPVLDALILRLHIETACRRGGALALRPIDLDPDQCLISLREKGGTTRSQPVWTHADEVNAALRAFLGIPLPTGVRPGRDDLAVQAEKCYLNIAAALDAVG